MSTDLTIAYFAHQRAGSAWWAALLSVDAEGDPLEFCHTDTVSLSRPLAALLGGRADAYMVTRVLVEPLLGQAQAPACVVCLDEPQVLLRRWPLSAPAAVFAPADAAHKEGAWSRHHWGDQEEESQAVWLSHNGNGSGPALEQARAAMAPFSLVEPFRQLRAAMADLHREAGK